MGRVAALRRSQGKPVASDQAFVGRRQQLDLISRRLREARSYQGSFVSLSGEPGIGKTRLAQAASAAARSMGFDVFWGFCHEGQYIPSFWPWRQMLEDLLRRWSLNRIRNRAALRSLSEAFAVRPGGARDAGLPKPIPQQARLRLLESFLSLIHQVSDRKPMLLVMENLHCADAPSLQLLEIAAREMSRCRAVIVGSHREGPSGVAGALRTTLGAVAGEPFFEEISLQGFGLSEVEECLHACGVKSPTPHLVQTVFERTDGNPLFVVEAARLLLRSGLPAAGSHTGSAELRTLIPPKVRMAILGLVHRLTARCRETVSTAALVGREFDLSVLADVLGEKESSVATILEEAIGYSLVEEISQSPQRYRFVHALIHEVVEKETGAARRSLLHQRAGEAMERRLGRRAEAHAGTLARQFDAAGPEFSGKALHYYQEAGERALRVYGFEDAFAQLSRALELARAQDEPLLVARLLFGLAQSQQGMGNIKAGLESYGMAFEVFSEHGDVDNAIRVLEQPLILFDRSAGIRQLLERAITLVGEGSLRADALGSKYGLALYRDTGDYPRAVSILDRALDAARKSKDREQEKATLVNRGWVEYHQLNFGGSHEVAAQVLKLAQDDRDVWTEGMARSISGLALLGLGRISDAEEQAQKASSIARRFNIRFVISGVSAFLFSLERQKGNLHGARQIADSVRNGGEEPYRTWHLINGALLYYEQGESSSGNILVKEVLQRQDTVDVPPHWSGSLGLVFPYLAWVSGQTEMLAEAESIALKVLSQGNLRRGDLVTVSAGLGLLAVIRGDRESAARLYDRLLPCEGLVANPSLGLSGDRLLALVALTADAHDRAIRHFEAGLQFCRTRGLLLELAYTCRDYAEFLLRTASPARRQRILDLCQTAEELSGRLGLVTLSERIQRVRGRIEEHSESRGAYPDSLSEREVEVLRLISQGLSNTVIGERLFISPHTVANHVRNILEKTGTANRTEAAAYAIRRGLAEST